MSLQDSRELGDVRILIVKGEKGDTGAGSYDDTQIREMIADETQERSQDFNMLNARIDNMVQTGVPQIKTLWSGTMNSAGTYTLSETVSNFDFLDIYFDQDVNYYLRVPANIATPVVAHIPWYDREMSPKPLYVGRVYLTFSGTSVTMTAPKKYLWDGNVEDSLNLDNAKEQNGRVSVPVRIDGVKYATLNTSELTDIRVGANGTTYPTAGDAVRGQVSDLKSDYNNTTYLAPITLEKCQTGNYIPNTSPKNVLAPSGASGTYNGKFVWDKCNSGDVYVVNLTALSGIYPWVICDKDGVVLSHGTQSQGETNKKIVIPSGGAYFGANCFGADDSVVKTQGLPYYNKDNANIVKKNVPFKFVHKYFNTTSPFDVDNVGVYSASYQGGIIWDKCKEGDVYILENVHMVISTGYIITICDEDGNIIAHALQAGNTHDIDYVNFYVEIPENGAYIGIQCNNTTSKVSKLVPIDEELNTIKENIFKGLKGVAFGTSLTARADSSGTYGYLSTLRNELECEIDNQGVGGSYWFLVDYTNSSVRYVVQNYASYADKDFAIIEGCVNDWFTGKILGNYTDTSGQSVCADLYAMINHIYTQNPKIQIFVILDHQGRNYNSNDCSPSAVVNNKTQYEYYSELKKLCELYSIPVISEFAESNIGVFGTEYLADNIHCNELGAEQSGQFIARKMKQIGLKVHN